MAVAILELNDVWKRQRIRIVQLERALAVLGMQQIDRAYAKQLLARVTEDPLCGGVEIGESARAIHRRKQVDRHLEQLTAPSTGRHRRWTGLTSALPRSW